MQNGHIINMRGSIVIDKAKRKILLSLTAAGVGTVTVSLGGLAVAANALDNTLSLMGNERLNLEVSQGWSADDLKVVIRNPSDSKIVITQMNPSLIHTDFGDIELDSLMETGPLRLAPNQAVSLHVHRGVNSKNNVSYSADILKSFQQAVSKQLSVVTGDASPARVSQVFHPRILV
jgi:hypothetical protein